MATKKTEEAKAPKKEALVKSKPSLTKSTIFSYGEIEVPLIAIRTREAFDTLYLGKLQRTDINKAWAEAEKQLAKFA